MPPGFTSTYCIAGTVPSMMPTWRQFMLKTTPEAKNYHYAHFADEMTHPKSCQRIQMTNSKHTFSTTAVWTHCFLTASFSRSRCSSHVLAEPSGFRKAVKARLTAWGSVTTLGLRARGEGVATGMRRGWLQAEDARMELWTLATDKPPCNIQPSRTERRK